VDAVLGLIGLVVFAACVIVFAAAMTWLVVKISPTRSSPQS
jgi:multisubunit Na+/H+ antiporter MnhB subunit